MRLKESNRCAYYHIPGKWWHQDKLRYNLKLDIVKSPALIFVLRIALVILGLLPPYMNLRNCQWVSVDFHTSILYPSILLSFFFFSISKTLLVEFRVFWRLCHLQIGIIWLFLFLYLSFSFLSFSHLIILAKILNSY